MGERGPAPKRSDKRLGHRAKDDAAGIVKAPAGEAVVVPPGDQSWHPIALAWYESLAKSGQSAFYVQSDWQSAYAVAESMSRELKPQPMLVGGKVEMHELPPKAASLTAWLKGAASLLATEGDRRRAGLELVRDWDGEEGLTDVSHLDDARTRLRGAG